MLFCKMVASFSLSKRAGGAAPSVSSFWQLKKKTVVILQCSHPMKKPAQTVERSFSLDSAFQKQGVCLVWVGRAGCVVCENIQ